MPKKPRENRVPIMLADEELEGIDNWRFQKRIATRSDAIRRLCQMGLLVDKDIDDGLAYLTERGDRIVDSLLKAFELVLENQGENNFLSHAVRANLEEVIDRLLEIGLRQSILAEGVRALQSGASATDAIENAEKMMEHAKNNWLATASRLRAEKHRDDE